MVVAAHGGSQSPKSQGDPAQETAAQLAQPVTWDVLAFGEAMLRLQPAGNERIEDADVFRVYTGGAELNTCYALAALGLRPAFFSVLPEGPLGRRVLRHLRGIGIDVSLVRTVPGRLGTYWVEYGPKPRSIEVHYDRQGSTVCHVRREDIPWEALGSSRVFYASGITPSLSPATRVLALEMAEIARASGSLVVTDLNYRARLWTPQEAAPVLERLARTAHVVVATEDDLRALFDCGGTAEEAAAQAFRRFGCRTLVLTRGSQGAIALEADRVLRSEVFPLSPVDRVGAGDAFVAGYLYATLTGRTNQALDYGLAMAALKHSVPGDTLTTTPGELERVVARTGGDIRR